MRGAIPLPSFRASDMSGSLVMALFSGGLYITRTRARDNPFRAEDIEGSLFDTTRADMHLLGA